MWLQRLADLLAPSASNAQEIDVMRERLQIVLTDHSKEYYVQLRQNINPETRVTKDKISRFFLTCLEFLLCESEIVVSSLKSRLDKIRAQGKTAEIIPGGIVYNVELTLEIKRKAMEFHCYVCIVYSVGPKGEDIQLKHDSCTQFCLLIQHVLIVAVEGASIDNLEIRRLRGEDLAAHGSKATSSVGDLSNDVFLFLLLYYDS